MRVSHWTILLLYSLVIFGCGAHVHHKVEKGETLYSIGFYYGQDYKDIAQWNKLDTPYVINEGQWLLVAEPQTEWWEKKRPIQNKSTKQHNPKKNNTTLRPVINNQKKPEKSKTIVVEDFTEKASPITKWIWPSEGKLLNYKGKYSGHNKGIDIAGKRGQPVYTSADGKVVYSGNGLIGYGQLIIIKHNKSYLSAYAHNDRMLVSEGEFVKQGQQIAKMGQTPDNHTLLHFEIRKNGKPVDPLRFLARRSR